MQQSEEVIKQLRDGPKKRFRMGGFWWLMLILVALAVGAGVWYWSSPEPVPTYQAIKAKRDTIRTVVSATGTLQPTSEVEVGSELSGRIKHIYVDYNDTVTKGQILARLDTEKLEAQVLQSRAALKIVEAGVLEVKASLAQAKNEFESIQKMRELSDGKLPSRLEYLAAQMQVEKNNASLVRSQAQVEQAKANLEQIVADLGKTDIVSPINGVVLIRSINEGQTVAATMSAPILFTLAEDLTSMELQVDVDEADVSQVKAGQEAVFTVDAYPGEKFPAVTQQVRFGAQSVNGVVTYKTTLKVSNNDYKLRPGMTAVAEILIQEKKDVLLIPQAALRFRPEWADAATENDNRSMMDSLVISPRSMRGSRNPPGGKNDADTDEEAQKVKIYRLINDQPQPVMIKIGERNGDLIEVIEGELSENDRVVTGVEVSSS